MIPFRKYSQRSGVWTSFFFSGVAIVAMVGAIGCDAFAGDLLRGGYTVANSSGSTAPGSFTPPSVAAARQNASDMLSRTTRALAAVRAMQGAARKLAISAAANASAPAFVPNGLQAGGLVPDSGLMSAGVANPVTTWKNADTPSQSTGAGGETTVTVVQTAPEATLNWSKFNIGSDTTLDIDQSKGGSNVSTWIAFNMIHDPSAVPSEILGAIKAPGQVYVIDQNGIIFGGSSEVNVHTLVASSLEINSTLVSQGLLNNPTGEFLFSALASPPGPNGPPNGDVIVQPGAILASPANSAHVGGLIALIGPNVDNEGEISTPDGQTILAAGLQVGIAAHPSSDATLRGLDVYVGAISSAQYPAADPAGAATNSGLISIPGGDLTMDGAIVTQNGFIGSSTTVTLNGRVNLLADYGAISNPDLDNPPPDVVLPPFIFSDTGTVILGPDSVTDILPQIDSSATISGEEIVNSAGIIVNSVLSLPSTVQIDGQAVHFEGNALLWAPDANVTVNAGFWGPVVQGANVLKFYSNATSSPQVYFDSGSVLDVAGSEDVSASVLQNIIQVQLLGAQLANDPLERDLLHGQTITVDVRDTGIYNGQEWVGTPLADASGYASLIQSTVGELTIGGGDIAINAGGSVVMQRGSQVNVSGGWIDYSGAVVDTTQLIAGGNIYDISQAAPDVVYSGILTGQFTVDHAKYGLTSTFQDPLIGGGHYEQGYIFGGPGGTISITAPSMALDGQLLGQTADGPRQVGATATGPQLQAMPGSLDLAFAAQDPTDPNGLFFPTNYPTPPSITFSYGALAPAGAFALNASGNPEPLAADRVAQVLLSPDLTSQDGFGILSVTDPTGDITIPAGVTVSAQGAEFYSSAPGATMATLATASITLLATNLTIDGSVVLPGGSLTFKAYDISPYVAAVDGAANPPPDVLPPAAGHGLFTLGADASLSTAGVIIDDRLGAPDPDLYPEVTAGGSVSIAAYNADLDGGSSIDVSGGVEMASSGSPAYGKGGKISIAAGQDPGVSSVTGGKLALDSELSGFAGVGVSAGSLSITAPLVRIGAPVASADSFVLSPDFFSQGGFGSFSITGVGAPTSSLEDPLAGLVIGSGAVIDPAAPTLVAESDVQTGNTITLTPMLLPQQSRPAINLTFSASGLTGFQGDFVARGDLVVSRGAVIESDPDATGGASISLNGSTVAVLGSVIAPGGSITVKGAGSSASAFPDTGNVPMVTVDLAPGSVLSTAGVPVPTANAYGYNTGVVLNGGSITVQGDIVAERGATLDVSGAQSSFDVAAADSQIVSPELGSFAGAPLIPTTVESNGGTISLDGAEELFVDATLRGDAGGPSATGGSLVIESGAFLIPNILQNPSTIKILVTQAGPTIPVPFYGPGQTAIGHFVIGSNDQPLTGMGYFAADTFESSGMDSLSLVGNVEFSGKVDLSANYSISAGSGGFIYADAPVTISAPLVQLGQAFQGPLSASQLQGQANGLGATNGQQFYISPTSGNGRLTVIADLIDIGNLSLQGIGGASFIADNGDIRGDGTLDVAGNVFMQAGQIYPPTADIFNIFAYDGGAVTFAAAGTRDLPLSAGGILNVYASVIDQGGVLRAPLGQINLGWDGVGASPLDPLTGAGYSTAAGIPTVPVATDVNLLKGSLTSVSAVDPVTGQGLIIPYGTDLNGVSWIDPTGTDITAGGFLQKSITISGKTIAYDAGSNIDISGGGDIFSYRFVPGTLGTVDILNTGLSSGGGFAIIPGYQAGFAPVNEASFSDAGLAAHIGMAVYLGAGAGVPAGVYTVLPAQYALLSGAYLVTPAPGAAPVGSAVEPDGSTLVSGYYLNGLDRAQTGQPPAVSFDVASQAILSTRGEYDTFLGDTFLATGAAKASQPVPPLPKDGGHLIVNAVTELTIAGSLDAQTTPGGRGAIVDISTTNPDGILIAGPGTPAGLGAGALVIEASDLDSFGAGSVLIGGVRTITGDTTSVDVTTRSITVDNAGDPLTGADIILAATGDLTLDNGAEVFGVGSAPGIGAISIVGNGALIRVSGNADSVVDRTGVTSGNTAALTIGPDAKISGIAVTLDSSQTTDLDATATISGKVLALNSGDITLSLPGAAAPNTGLVLTSAALEALGASAESLSLLSYESINIYGSGQIGATNAAGDPLLDNLSIQAGAINGIGGGAVTFAAKTILLGNQPQSTTAASLALNAGGTLTFKADTIDLGIGQLNIGDFGGGVTLNASGGVLAVSRVVAGVTVQSGELTTAGDLGITAPLITAVKGEGETISSGGALTITSAGSATVGSEAGSGATLSFIGESIDVNSNITATAGAISMEATGAAGGIVIGDNGKAVLDAGGASQSFYDVTQFSNGGSVTLAAVQAGVTLDAGATINVSAISTGNANAGTLTVSVPEGALTVDPAATLNGHGGELAGNAGLGGGFSLDAGTLASTSQINDTLNTAGFSDSRTFRVRTSPLVTIDGEADASTFQLSVDQGAIEVTSAGFINAAGATGGAVVLDAAGNITLDANSEISAVGANFNDAGQGGSVSIETTGGVIDIAKDSTIDLSVTAAPSGAGALQDVSGTLLLRAPQLNSASQNINTLGAAAANTGVSLAVNPIAGTITGAGSVVAEGFYAQVTNAPAANIDSFEAAAESNAKSFMQNYAAITSNLADGDASLAALIRVAPGEEIDNTGGSLVLNNDWDLSTLRYGPTGALSNGVANVGADPGILTLRAAGSIVFNGALSDGFGTGNGVIPVDSNGVKALWEETLLPTFANGKSELSWSFSITSGADLSAANVLQVLPAATLAQEAPGSGDPYYGSVEIGNPAGGENQSGDGTVASAIEGYYQVIRTGAGSINIAAATDVQLLDQFASIYSAGTQVSAAMGGATLNNTFVVPEVISTNRITVLSTAQFNYGGGDVDITAQEDITHLIDEQLPDGTFGLGPDSERELPVNWLYRQGYVTASGQFGDSIHPGTAEATAWWIDFTNFFEGVGALGGGNVSLVAGNDVSNVDAVIPTNGRMPGAAPKAGNLVELGGGDLLVSAGHDINGGVYYVERGAGVISAGNEIETNYTRSATTSEFDGSALDNPDAWLPTTLFAGDSSFDVFARGDILLGPVVNPFWLPVGIGNGYFDKTYFSTYSETAAVNIVSYGGDVTLRNQIASGVDGTLEPVLQAWFNNELGTSSQDYSVALFQPWLQVNETDSTPFSDVYDVMPGTLDVTAFSGSINLAGNFILSPSPTGNLELLAADSINALLPVGGNPAIPNSSAPTVFFSDANVVNGNDAFASSEINVSDANPALLPGVANPDGFLTLIPGKSINQDYENMIGPTNGELLNTVNIDFDESGSPLGTFAVIQTKQALHADLPEPSNPSVTGPLHAGDENPVRLYAAGGDLSGLLLFTPKVTRIAASQDVTDIALYLQNDSVDDFSLVTAGRDLLPYDVEAPLFLEANDAAAGNLLENDTSGLAGDIEIGGPGTLEVLAGRNLTLGNTGGASPDGTGVGILTIGQTANPSLPFAGADLVVAASLGSAAVGPGGGLSGSPLDFSAFITQFIEGPDGSRYLGDLGQSDPGLGVSSLADFDALDQEQKDNVALQIFYLVLRDAGRDHNLPGTAGFGNYAAGYAAIAALIPASAQVDGDIDLTSREIETTSGGNISIFAPGGQLTVGVDTSSNQPAFEQGILTEDGGNISIYVKGSVNIGTSRIFTLRGGNEVMWSTAGDIDAGAASKTVQSAPPTEVLVDPQSANVETNLAGLATGGGIGVLASVAGVAPGSVDLIAPGGVINAGDAGIRATGNLNLAAVQVLNASNIQAGGASSGVPTVTVSAPNLGALAAASATVGATQAAASQQGNNQPANNQSDQPSIFNVEVLGYGGGDSSGQGG